MGTRFFILVVSYFSILALIAVPLGRFMARVFAGQNRASAKLLGPVERLVFRLSGVDPTREHSARRYTLSLLAFSLVTEVTTYAILRLQAALPLNPAHAVAVPPWLALNTATSFASNTNWQSYAGESTMSYFAQAVALTSQNFFSAGVGVCVAIALIRGIARAECSNLGNFWVDLVRVHLYVLLPLAGILALFLVSQGVIQTWRGPTTWLALGGSLESIARGPVASQEAIKLLGTNGGGFFNANSAHPFENPTPLSNFVEMLAILAVPAALCVTLGEMVNSRAHGRAVFVSMLLIALLGVFVIGLVEHHGNPATAGDGMSLALGNMEGKEVRFGVPESALFVEVTTAASCGAVNCAHDSLMPLAGLVALLNIELGEVVFGGVGSGLYGALVYVVLAIFLAGLMVGRTPEYLGKKIDSRDVRFASLFVLLPAYPILVFTALALMTPVGRAAIHNTAAHPVANTTWSPDPHGFSEVLYAFSSATGNNGSAFAGLETYSSKHPVFYSVALSVAMFAGRFGPIALVLSLAGNMAKKKRVPVSAGSFPVSGAIFVGLLVTVILVISALTFFPALSLGPVAEQLLR